MTADALLAIAEDLYGLPLAQFTAARDARARELKGQQLAGPVKALRKPATAAWVVDLLVRRENDQVTRMIAVGDALRQAQEGMDAAALRELTKQRRQLTAALTVRARALARSVGLKVTEQVAEQVEETLTAAMIDPLAAQAVRSGLLVAPLRATGVGPVDAASAVALPDALGFAAAPVADPPVSLRVVPDPEPDRRALEEARAALAEADTAVTEAEAERDAAAADLERLQARSLQVQAELDELRRRLAELEETAQEVDDELAEAEETHTQAETAVASAVRRRDAAAQVESGLRPG
ncbi:hypothetical protein P5P86_08345 [Nocardioides sp. BP30]|uniref:hypothetical protein n=1 Tax=Nocardioides sp. BP30 TaxID=3036374 RepID=UPI00246998A8|nr:hypothetical protein [Nocardioides sp. BP30]WGL53826.1 hypothetical protein P5P86_08345 [Nocardioides sp. BP30]